ncbi:MAG: UDP-N-acetylglucosamine 2-epimerase (non-hydrolyzing) [Bacteroidetes bacterium]|nr:UDP-N-acetylglucosamine 2-epimerase (non-hydrolyzing) [Bacteroidota bacterium]
MNKLKVAVVVGTRPEIIRLSRVIAKIDEFCDLVLIHTGQNYDFELNEIFFSQLAIPTPHHFLNAAASNAAQTIGQIIISVDEVLQNVQPDAIVILGDTNSALSAIAAKRRKIPIFHMEAGNRCFDQRVPEEINRRIVDHISDINLTYSSIAREYLLREGIPPDMIIKTGSPMLEVLNFYQTSINESMVLGDLGLKPNGYFVISAHREENIDSEINFKKLTNLLNALAEKYKLPIIVSAHPRTAKKFSNNDVKFNSLIQLLKPLGFPDYIKLQVNSKAVLSDSGTITEESSILNFPAINLREAHERPEGMEEAFVMMTGLNQDIVFSALDMLEQQGRGVTRTLHTVDDYSSSNVSDKVVRIIHSYTHYVNRKVWNK